MCRHVQVALDAGFRVVWSDMDTAWLKNFSELAPHDRDVVLADDSEEEEQTSENTCTGAAACSPLPPAIHAMPPSVSSAIHCCFTV